MTQRPPRANSKRQSLSTLLRVLSESSPKTASHLSQAQLNRERHLSQYLHGARLRGHEELIGHLEELQTVFQRSRRLRGISPLIGRVAVDFQVALEATLSGFNFVAHDAMRDVMEVEFLLREFYYTPASIEGWLRATQKELNDKFRPAVLRQRHAARLGVEPQDLPEASDYRGHSALLHVIPHPLPLVGRDGVGQSEGPFDTEICFWEMFEHALRLLVVAHHLRRRIARHLKSPWGPWRGLKRFRDGWDSTQEMKEIWMHLLRTTPVGDDADAE